MVIILQKLVLVAETIYKDKSVVDNNDPNNTVPLIFLYRTLLLSFDNNLFCEWKSVDYGLTENLFSSFS